MSEDKKKSMLTGRKMFEILENAGVVFPKKCRGFELTAVFDDAAMIKFDCYIELNDEIVKKEVMIDLTCVTDK
jgi:hypothetical protein